MSTVNLPVRVWLGYALPTLRSMDGRNQFRHKLGSVFMPATVQLMAPYGLTAYLPTVVPQDTSPDVPDEVALVFYRTTEAYHEATTLSTGGRAYSLLHSTLFAFTPTDDVPASRSGFPSVFDRESFVAAPQGSFALSERELDWQSGATRVSLYLFSGTVPIPLLADEFAQLQATPPALLQDCLITLQGQCLVVWSHWREHAGHPLVLDTDQGMRVVLDRTARDVHVPPVVTAPYGGLTVSDGDSLNFRFAVK